MESKIFIDVDAGGQPQIRIDYKHTGDGSDVRDKLMGRFISDVIYADPKGKSVDVSLEHGHDDREGGVVFIRLKPKNSPESE